MPDGRWEADPAAFIAELNAMPGDELLAYLSEFPDDQRKALINLLSKDAAKRHLKAYMRSVFRLGRARWHRPRSRAYAPSPSQTTYVVFAVIFGLIVLAWLADLLGYL